MQVWLYSSCCKAWYKWKYTKGLHHFATRIQVDLSFRSRVKQWTHAASCWSSIEGTCSNVFPKFTMISRKGPPHSQYLSWESSCECSWDQKKFMQIKIWTTTKIGNSKLSDIVGWEFKNLTPKTPNSPSMLFAPIPTSMVLKESSSSSSHKALLVVLQALLALLHKAISM